ncbi:hypothetical protein pb186bvf_019575 [Paramecium bursaria]
MDENPNKTRIKQQYFHYYKQLLNISKLKVAPVKPQLINITAVNLDHIDRVYRLRSKSFKPIDDSIDFATQNSKSPTRVYTAIEMSEMIRQAKRCGMLYNKSQQNDQLYERNFKHQEAIRQLESTWHYQKIRRQEENKQFNSKSIEHHYVEIKQKRILDPICQDSFFKEQLKERPLRLNRKK